MWLLNAGMASADDAIRQVRAVRPGAIKTVEQEQFLEGWGSEAQWNGKRS